MNTIAIRVTDVHKSFKVYYDKGQTFKEKILFQNRNRHETRTVLDGINFKVKKGEAVGLIGQNGCGKSTLLKLMTKILYPDEGLVEMNGRISSLIELGAGFHPDMTGKENIYTNASIFGLTRKEIDLRLQTIIDFSELGEFIDNPVRTYSSGMYMRLAFAVAINVDAEILLIDEILAVGDASFQAKCFNKLREAKSHGTTIVIVSHSLGQIEQFCETSIWIADGIIKLQGRPNEVHPQYLDFMGQKNQSFMQTVIVQDKVKSDSANKEAEEASYNSEEPIAKITKVEMLHEDGKSDDHFKTGECVTLKITYRAIPDMVDQPLIGLKLFRNDGEITYGINTQNEHVKIQLKSDGIIFCKFEKLNLITGEYFFDVAIRSQGMFAYDYVKAAVRFTVYCGIYEIGIVHLDHKWSAL